MAITWQLQSVWFRRESSMAVLEDWRERSSSVRHLLADRNHVRYLNADRMAELAVPDDETGAPVSHAEYLKLLNLRREAVRTLIAVQSHVSALGGDLQSHGERRGTFMANCLPAGGRWVSVRRRSVFKHLKAGRMCCGPICPWCWMRRYVEVRRRLAVFGPPWRVTRWTCADNPDRVAFDAAMRVLWRNRPQKPQAEGGGVPEFISGLCLRTVFPAVKGGLGQSAAVVHGAPLDDLREGHVALNGLYLQLHRHSFTDLDQALRWAWPLAVELWDKRPVELKKLMDGPLKRRRSYEEVEVVPRTAVSW